MKYVKTFEQFINEKYESVNEASFPGRAWSGKLSNLDNLFSYMYDKDMLTQKEKKIKDRVFRAYYRYYNDGDFPKGIANKYGVHRYDTEEKIEKALEQYVEEFMKAILSKYSEKIDRTDFRLSQLLSELHTLRGVVAGYEASGLLRYWSKKTKVDDTRFGSLLKELSSVFKAWESEADKTIDKWLKSNKEEWGGLSKNLVPRAKKERMEKEGAWETKHDKLWKQFTGIMDKMTEVLDDVIKVTTDAKTALGE